MTYRNRALLNLAHDLHDCTIRIPGVCQGYVVEGLHPCHANWQWFDRGSWHKAHDIFAAGCPPCHDAIDRGNKLTRDEKQGYWLRGAVRTWLALMMAGSLVVVPRRNRRGVT